MPRQPPTEHDRGEAIRRLLDGLVGGGDAVEIARQVVDLHPKNDTFPGEVYLRVGAAALAVAGATPDAPIPYEGLLATYLPELEFRGRDNRKVRFALLASASLRAGLEPDVFDEVSWWQTDDLWRYALGSAVALIRAGTAHRNMALGDFIAELKASLDSEHA